MDTSYPWLYPSQVLEPPANPVRFNLAVTLRTDLAQLKEMAAGSRHYLF